MKRATTFLLSMLMVFAGTFGVAGAQMATAAGPIFQDGTSIIANAEGDTAPGAGLHQAALHRKSSKEMPPSPFTGSGYYYAGAHMSLTGTDSARGLGAKLYLHQNYIENNNGEHVLTEISAQDPSGNAVEFGIVQFATGPVKLFASTWNAGTWNGCYDASVPACKVTDNASNPIDLGADLSAVAALCNGSSLACVKQFTMYWSNTACGVAASGWRLDYDGSNVACVNPNAFTGGFTSSQYFQAFGEVYYAGATKPKTDMGNGKASNIALGNAGPAYVGSLSLVTPTPSTLLTDFTANTPTDAAAYDITMYVDANGKHRTFGYGGAGYRWNGSAWVTPGDIGS